MINTIKILVPRLDNSGPANGAKALEYWLSSSTDYKISIHETKKGLADFSNVDLVISMCFSAEFHGIFAKYRYKKKWISTLRSNIFEDYRYLYGTKGIFIAAIHNFLILFADKVVCMYGDMSNKLLMPIRQTSCVICPNLIAERDQIVDSICLPLQRLVVIGSLSRRKGILELIDIFKTINNLNLQLVFIGNGELKQTMEKMIKASSNDKNIVLFGYSAEPYANLRAGDYVLSNSESEGMSRALMDCVHGGVPVICRDLGQATDFIINEKNGFKFHNIDELKIIIQNLASGVSSIKCVKLPSKYSPRTVIENWIRIIETVFH